jgi:Galactose oxidase, central domain
MANFLWTERADFGPVARRRMAMAYDSVRGVTVMFGGDPVETPYLGDTWEWDGKAWAQVSNMGPAARSVAAMVFAADEKAGVLFGGKPAGGPANAFGDTWRWDGTAWTELLNSGPMARSGHGMAFDSNRNRIVLFGGLSGSGGPLGDTWEFDGTAWTEQMVEMGPSGRSGVAMAYDDVGKRVVVFGGVDVSANVFGDTWTWDGQKWVQIAEFGPAARFDATMSGWQGSLVLMGGTASGSATPFLDTWQLSGNLWKQLANIGPGPLCEAASVVDSGRNVVVLFGGVTAPITALGTPAGGISGNTWEGPLPAPPLAVLLATLQIEGDLLVTLITLNRPAPAGGASVNVSLTNQGQTVAGSPVQLSAAAGDTVVGTFESSLPAGTYILTAQIPGTPAVSGSITF